MLQETVGRALKLSQEAAARMEELQIQLSVLQRQCTYRDRPLCDTLRIRSFEENGVVDALKTVSPDRSRAPLCMPHLIFALFGFIVCPFHYFHFSFSPLLLLISFIRCVRHIPFPRQFVSCKRTRASFACATWVKLNSGPPSRIWRRKSASHVPSSAISRNKLNTTRRTSGIVSQQEKERLSLSSRVFNTLPNR